MSSKYILGIKFNGVGLICGFPLIGLCAAPTIYLIFFLFNLPLLHFTDFDLIRKRDIELLGRNSIKN